MPWVLTRGERRRRNRLQGGRLHLGTVAGIKSEWWPTSSRNRWPACVGIRILDALVPPEIPIPALAEVQVALQEAAATVTGERGDGLKRRLRTGTVVTYDDRNWELRWSQERRQINLSRAIAVDMESGTVAAQGYRLRVPYGTLLCVSDKPLHGEIKLPGAANAFYERAVGEHLMIGVGALEILRDQRAGLHSRKLRSFDEPPFR
jgi:AMP nucleosidase